MARLKAVSICPICKKAVEKGNSAFLVSRVNVLSKPRVEYGISQSSYQNQAGVSDWNKRTTFLPRYLVHSECFASTSLMVPTKEGMYDLQAESRETTGEIKNGAS